MAELRAALPTLAPEELSDAELDALVESATRDEPELALEAAALLAGLAGESKARQKSYRRGLHRLRQRGLDVASLEAEAPRDGGLRLAPEHGPGGGLPVLLAPPDINAQRQMTFALARGPGVIVVDALFKARELFRLMAQPSNRPAYRRFARSLAETTGATGLPERVELGPEWLARKLWELGRYRRDGALGREVDKGLLDFLDCPADEPPHPALALELGGARPLSVAQLAEQPHRLHAFYHGAALGALRQQYYEAGGESGVVPGEAGALELREAMQKPVADWVEQWGVERVVEVLLDAALFFGGVGDTDAAATFVDLARPRPGEPPRLRDGRLREFLLDVVLWQLTR